MQCLEIQVGHLGWDSLQGRTFAFRHILGDVCMWDHYMLTEISAFMFNIVCIAQCKSLEDKLDQSRDRGCHGTSCCCPNLCFWYTSECRGLQQLCQENTDLKVICIKTVNFHADVLNIRGFPKWHLFPVLQQLSLSLLVTNQLCRVSSLVWPQASMSLHNMYS